MSACPSCQAEVEEGADLCLSCGEPIGDSPAARLARSESRPSPGVSPLVEPNREPASPPSAQRVRSTGSAPAQHATVVGSPAAKRRRVEEPEPVRCPGCGVPSRGTRCPGCGGVLRHSDD